MFTVRTTVQGGAFLRNMKKEAVDILKLMLRLGCEYIDVEMTLPPHFIKEIVHLKDTSQIIAERTSTRVSQWSSQRVRERYVLPSTRVSR